MAWKELIDESKIGAAGGVAAFSAIPVSVKEDYDIPDGGGRYVIVDSGEGTVRVNLPDPSVSDGYDVVIKVTDASNGVSIYPNDGENIDGSKDKIMLDVDNAYVRLVSDGVDWYVIG
ncbi:MAG: hypothetical protein M0R69_01360 [Candidatus Cloacimonetes bacterium]|jgi:hypothetical protein|nr:hypothetical protein [Candidatus Cloacimonadota bacterium]